MAPAPSSPLQDLGTLVLSNDPLDLEQEVVLRAGADGAVEEGDLNASAPELLHQQGLVRMTPSEPVGCEDVDAVDVPGGHCIAQSSVLPFAAGWLMASGAALTPALMTLR